MLGPAGGQCRIVDFSNMEADTIWPSMKSDWVVPLVFSGPFSTDSWSYFVVKWNRILPSCYFQTSLVRVMLRVLRTSTVTTFTVYSP
jgi:hypothetical protein